MLRVELIERRRNSQTFLTSERASEAEDLVHHLQRAQLVALVLTAVIRVEGRIETVAVAEEPPDRRQRVRPRREYVPVGAASVHEDRLYLYRHTSRLVKHFKLAFSQIIKILHVIINIYFFPYPK